MRSLPDSLTGISSQVVEGVAPPLPGDRLYSRSYFDMRRQNEAQRYIAYKQEYRRVTERTIGLNVLDYGCGDGSFLELFSGWHCYGVEVSEYCIKKCTEKGIKMVNTADLMDEGFDLVIFRGVLQHIDRPFEALSEAARILRQGGVIAILAQPDADSLCYRLFGELPALDPPRNWWIPGRQEVENILGRLGFRNVETLHPYWSGPYAKPARDIAYFILRLFGIRNKFPFPGNMMEIYAQKG